MKTFREYLVEIQSFDEGKGGEFYRDQLEELKSRAKRFKNPSAIEQKFIDAVAALPEKWTSAEDQKKLSKLYTHPAIFTSAKKAFSMWGESTNFDTLRDLRKKFIADPRVKKDKVDIEYKDVYEKGKKGNISKTKAEQYNIDSYTKFLADPKLKTISIWRF